jgi:hypothetical protein
MKLSKIKPNPNNPRIIKDDKFEKLKKSIKDFPKMMELRPMVINSDNIVLGGNMRLKALKELGYKEVPDEWVKRAEDLTEDEQRQFIIKDNVGFGEHDWEMLATEWGADELTDWGLDVPLHEHEIDNSEEGEVIEIPKSLQVMPKKEYVIIMADEDSEEWQELQQIFKCGLVRQGGCKIGSSSDKVGKGIERVFDLKTFKKRVLNEFSDSNTK